MTPEEFIQTLMLLTCLLAGSVVLPVGMVVTSTPHVDYPGGALPDPVVVFD